MALIKELGFDRVPSGGAGNKMLMLLEGKGAAYIQDRGVSRWGECLYHKLYPFYVSHSCDAPTSLMLYLSLL